MQLSGNCNLLKILMPADFDRCFPNVKCFIKSKFYQIDKPFFDFNVNIFQCKGRKIIFDKTRRLARSKFQNLIMKKLRKFMLHPESLLIYTFFSSSFLLKFISFQLISFSVIFDVNLS